MRRRQGAIASSLPTRGRSSAIACVSRRLDPHRHPAVDTCASLAARRHAIGRRKTRIELDRPIEKSQRLARSPPRVHWMNCGNAAQIADRRRRGSSVGLRRGALDLGLLAVSARWRRRRSRSTWSCSSNTSSSEPSKRSAQRCAAGRRVDQLAGDAHPAAGLAHAAFEHVAHAQFAADLLHVDGAGPCR